MRLINIPDEKYYEYRINAMFDCYKWDPQFYDNNTIAKNVLVLSKQENEEIKKLTEALDKETREAENYLNKHMNLAKKLRLPRRIIQNIPHMQSYNKERNIRLMRYDFHPSCDGKWVVTEVNSDVPGGFAESSLLPELAKKTLNLTNYCFNSFGENMVNAINEKLRRKRKHNDGSLHLL